jgi:hypothetical protein
MGPAMCRVWRTEFCLEVCGISNPYEFVPVVYVAQQVGQGGRPHHRRGLAAGLEYQPHDVLRDAFPPHLSRSEPCLQIPLSMSHLRIHTRTLPSPTSP